MSDRFSSFTPGLESPASHLNAISPDDANDLAQVTRAINVGNGGQVRVTTLGGETVTLTIAAGIAFPVRATRVWATGTTASAIVGMS